MARAPSKGTPRILIVALEAANGAAVAQYLSKDGFAVSVSADLELGFRQAHAGRPTLIVLDLGGLKKSGPNGGATWARRARADEALLTTPILVIVDGPNEDLVTGMLNAGADDVVSRPLRPREITARVRAILRRAAHPDADQRKQRLRVGTVELDLDSYEVFAAGTLVSLTLAEFRLLAVLMARTGWVFSRQQLLDQITDGETIIVGRNVDVHILALRQKLGASASIIVTVRGTGYKVEDV